MPTLNEILYDIFGPGFVVLLIVVPVLFKLGSDLAKLNTEVAYQLNRDLLTKRFTAYGDLWARMKPVAIYTGEEFGPCTVKELSESLSLWYFSSEGGLFLTERAKSFYFAFQNLLITVGDMSEWTCQERPGDPKGRFLKLLRCLDQDKAKVEECLNHLESERPDLLDPQNWLAVCELLSTKLKDVFKKNQHDPLSQEPADVGREIYSTIQQVSSILRSNLAWELQSRLDLPRPKV